MTRVNISELRSQLPRYLDRVEAGEEVLITRHGRIVARLLAVGDPRAEAKAALARLRAQARVGDVISPVDEPWEAER